MNTTSLSLFLFAALMIAVVPGPGIFYVAARTLSGGRWAGFASTIGTGLGGLVHVMAGAVGVSAIILASAELFAALKLIGAFYLVWLGFRTFRDAGRRTPDRLATADARAGFPGRRPRRGPESENRGVLPGLHSAIHRSSGRSSCAALHRARRHLGDAQYISRYRRGADGLERKRRFGAASTSASTPATRIGDFHRRARPVAGVGAASRELSIIVRACAGRRRGDAQSPKLRLPWRAFAPGRDRRRERCEDRSGAAIDAVSRRRKAG